MAPEIALLMWALDSPFPLSSGSDSVPRELHELVSGTPRVVGRAAHCAGALGGGRWGLESSPRSAHQVPHSPWQRGTIAFSRKSAVCVGDILGQNLMAFFSPSPFAFPRLSPSPKEGGQNDQVPGELGVPV